MELGSVILGAEAPAEGLIRNLDVAQGGTSSLVASYTHQGFAEGEHHALGYMDGDLAGVDADGALVIGGVTPGEHNFNLMPQVEYLPASTVFFDEEDGRRVLLTWLPASGAVSLYRIYRVDLDGNNPVLAGEARRRCVTAANYMYPTTGSGMGRIVGAATPVPEGVNGALTLTITGPGEYAWALGTETGSGTFARGTVVTMAHNIKIFFYDDPAEYATDDEFVLWCGPERRWTSGPLVPGNYRYGISAVGVDGEESVLTLTPVYEVVELPQAQVLSTEWDGDTETLRIEVSAPMRLYSNWYADEGWFDDYVSLLPQVVITDALDLDFAGAAGKFMYYLRPYDPVNDVENPDFTLRTVDVPAVSLGVTLGTPINAAGSARGVMKWAVTFDYELLEGDQVTRLDVYRVTAGSAFAYDASDRVGSLTPNALTTEYELVVDDGARLPGDISVVVAAHAGPDAADPMNLSGVVTITLTDAASVGPVTGVVGGTA